MAIKGMTLSSVERYVSDLDPAKKAENQEGATVFVLGSIDNFISGSVIDRVFRPATTDSAARIMVNGLHLETVRYGLRDWDNFKNSEGQDVKFETQENWVSGKRYDTVHEDCLRQIPLDVIRELSNRIQKMTSVSEAEVKN